MKKIGIDLLWVKVGKNGGAESYIRNILDGLNNYADEKMFNFILFLTEDNYKSFEKYFKKEIFKKVILPIKSERVFSRIIKENILLDKYAKKEKIDLMFVPVYSKPLIKNKKIPYIITIHDLQALHYPEYFSKIKNLWLRFAWKRCAQTADKIVAISNFVKKDIEEKFDIDSKKITVIYNPITGIDNIENFQKIKNKYNIEKNNYYYTVSSLLPHKNLKTLLYTMKKIKESNLNIPKKLVISGVGGKSEAEIKKIINDLNIQNEIILTGFISNEERNSLYKNAKIFLFPSIFEGFGMPPIEAMNLGTPVITTKKASIYEVTKGKAIYVEDPFNEGEWFEKINKFNEMKDSIHNYKEYDLENIIKRYINLFKEKYKSI
ncbi:glycosyltransferase family 4 protein [Geotoga petraea]|uniref:Glycosyltransferase involved in cell wall bisynthesis n=1 Tax=Geotoga petraea TaxID=28234 RepID=A0A1G6PKJ5_9BACT|nr:glycosyltransferase family 1 protein [Geotoga petraea]SDC80036.1 Glycosyltransferase involved in cell wall bisynthesis [Geotoga petraea]